MSKTTLFVLVTILSISHLAAQKSYYFIDNNTLDTISQYKLKFYSKNDIAIYIPSKNNSVVISKKKIREADSIILYFDLWYKKNIHKNAFNENIIYVKRRFHLNEIVIIGETDVKKENKIIGTFNKNFQGVETYEGRGSLVSFELNEPSKIKKFELFIRKNKIENSSFIPVLFIADSINDPNKIYLYPKKKSFIIKEKIKKEWLNISIKEYSGQMKSKIFAGYIAKNSNIVFGTARAKNNTFLDDYFGSDNTIGNMWRNEYVYRVEDYYVPAIKIELEK